MNKKKVPTAILITGKKQTTKKTTTKKDAQLTSKTLL